MKMIQLPCGAFVAASAIKAVIPVVPDPEGPHKDKPSQVVVMIGESCVSVLAYQGPEYAQVAVAIATEAVKGDPEMTMKLPSTGLLVPRHFPPNGR